MLEPFPKGFIFDLDGTLYNTKALDRANRAALTEAVEKAFSCSSSDARAMLDNALGKYEELKGRPSLYGAALKLGVPDKIIAEAQLRVIIPENLLDPDPVLVDLMTRLSQAACLALLTNTRTELAARALAAMGLNRGVMKIIKGGDRLERPKPSVADVLLTCQEMGLDPTDCISVGDRWAVDLEPAVAAGLRVKKVEDRDDLVRWLQAECL